MLEAARERERDRAREAERQGLRVVRPEGVGVAFETKRCDGRAVVSFLTEPETFLKSAAKLRRWARDPFEATEALLAALRERGGSPSSSSDSDAADADFGGVLGAASVAFITQSGVLLTKERVPEAKPEFSPKSVARAMRQQVERPVNLKIDLMTHHSDSEGSPATLGRTAPSDGTKRRKSAPALPALDAAPTARERVVKETVKRPRRPPHSAHPAAMRAAPLTSELAIGGPAVPLRDEVRQKRPSPPRHRPSRMLVTQLALNELKGGGPRGVRGAMMALEMAPRGSKTAREGGPDEILKEGGGGPSTAR